MMKLSCLPLTFGDLRLVSHLNANNQNVDMDCGLQTHASPERIDPVQQADNLIHLRLVIE